MRILLIGATGTIGSAIASALSQHDVIGASRSRAAETVDITDAASIHALLKRVRTVDAIICAAGGGAWKPLAELTDADFESSVHDKLMGQVNVARYGFASVADGGSITLTSGVLATQPMVNSAAISLVNSGVEGFGRAAALEAPRGIRVNVVSPPWVSETLAVMGQDPSWGLTAEVVARAYVASVEGAETGKIISP
ncbi:MAG: short chain dehydrogenase [Gemmatimonadetes bacterium]|nr:short chain dehydrogenase [Gemmatimonadota bacterium]